MSCPLFANSTYPVSEPFDEQVASRHYSQWLTLTHDAVLSHSVFKIAYREGPPPVYNHGAALLPAMEDEEMLDRAHLSIPLIHQPTIMSVAYMLKKMGHLWFEKPASAQAPWCFRYVTYADAATGDPRKRRVHFEFYFLRVRSRAPAMMTG